MPKYCIQLLDYNLHMNIIMNITSEPGKSSYS